MTTTAEAIIDLDRKVSRAMAMGRGISLRADQLDALASIGLIERLADAKATILKEQARCRQIRAGSISGEGSGSTSPEAPAADPPAANGTSGGTTPPQDASAARARARKMFG
ncbi:hypothetical protein [Sphingomonas sanxanigenens]|uniref:Uncharacterized protein n=1 Tax=Sphingomonas sanxanigenens DSM 19645 = NX02 TaxID=1123269 RepID=W0AJT3_9SPHN|nr:hypothetical protein [Sphingomonas sanxanigenens]AHE57401.1 hypothetical protein NX02_29165 [Sphingomonas sanxanigenens DSM 19645 = NX02]